MYGLADAQVSAAAAEVAVHGFIDVLVCRLGVPGEQSSGRHDLAGLAVTALGHVHFEPGLLQGSGVVGREAFERGDAVVGRGGERSEAGARGFAVEVNGAGAALADAAAIFRGVKVEHVADDPEKRGIGRRVDDSGTAVDRQIGRHTLNSKDNAGGAA